MRRLSYKSEYVDAIYDAIKNDVSLFKLANDWGVASGTFYNWSLRYPKFKVAMEVYRKIKHSQGEKRFFNRKQPSPNVKHSQGEKRFFNRKQPSPNVKHEPYVEIEKFVGGGFNSKAAQLIIKHGFPGVKKWLIP